MTLPAFFDGQATASHSWRAPGPALLAHVDLSGLVENGLVTGVQVQADGGLVIECPNGLPADLAGMVEPLDDVVEDRIARLERGLSRLALDLAEKERITDRLDAVEFGLTEKLQGVIAEELFNLVAEQEEAGPTVADRVDAILTAVQDQGGATDAEILTRIEELCARPAPQVELAPMRQMNSRFLQAMSQVMTRLETSIEALQKPASQGFDDLAEQVAALASRVETFRPIGDLTDAVALLADRVSAMEARPVPMLDLTEQRTSFAAFATALGTALRRMEAVTDQLSAPDEGNQDVLRQVQSLTEGLAQLNPAPVEAALRDLTDRIAALESRPTPQPDLSEQRKSLAGFATAFGAILRRVESVTDRWESTQPTDGAITALTERIDAQLAEVVPTLSAKLDALAKQDKAALDDLLPGLTARLDTLLAACPEDPALPAVNDKLDRILAAQGPREVSQPEVSQKLDAILSAQHAGNRDHLAEAILALAGRVAEPRPSLPGIESFHAAQQDFFQDLRFLLAEIVATQMRLQAAG